MRKFVVLTLICFTASFLNAQDKGVKFEDLKLNEAFAKAKKTKKMVFLDCYTSWCGPCKEMAREVFPSEEVGKYLNQRFISIKMDMEKGEGPSLATKYGVKAYPTFLIFDGNGKEICRLIGGANANRLIQKIEEGIKPENSIDKLKEAYEAKKSMKTGLPYAQALNKMLMNAKELVRELYINSNEKEKFQYDFLKILCSQIDYKDSIVRDLCINKNKIDLEIGSQVASKLIAKTYSNLLYGIIYGGVKDVNNDDVEQAALVIGLLSFPQTEVESHIGQIALLIAKKDYVGLTKYYETNLSYMPDNFEKSKLYQIYGMLAANASPEQKGIMKKFLSRKSRELNRLSETLKFYDEQVKIQDKAIQ